METKIAEFIQCIDQAIGVAEQLRCDPSASAQLGEVVTVLNELKNKALLGQLEPSGGTTTLGLVRGVADWIDSLDSPLVKVMGQIEEYYQTHL